MSNSRSSITKKTDEKSLQKSKKLSAEEKLLQQYDGIIVRHPKEEGRFFCTLCHDGGSLHFSGLWNNCKEHISSQAHKKYGLKAKQDPTDDREATSTEMN